jgi:hypothetical protein
MKDLQELYVACGGESSGDGFVKLPAHFKPIDIVIKVVPTGLDLSNDQTLVEFAVLVPDKLEGVEPGILRHIEYTVPEITLPIEAVHLGGFLELRKENGH